MNTIYLILGSNLGDTSVHLSNAKAHIELKVGTIVKSSSTYHSPPWGFEDANDFVNRVLVVESHLSAHQVLSVILQIEEDLGRKRSAENGYQSRVIDIDILFFNEDIIYDDSLIIPHPRLHERRFTLLPLNEVEENLIHPELKLPVWKLLLNCTDRSAVIKI